MDFLFRKRRHQPIPTISLSEVDPRFRLTELGPSLQSEINFIPNIKVKGGISDLETWILCMLAKSCKKIFEFGTCTGKTAYLLARNTPPESRIVTITLPPQAHQSYQAKQGDSQIAYEEALAESCFQTFYYSGTPEQEKIIQLFDDSKKFDEVPFQENFDLIFIDGSHAYSYVLSDTEKALKMVKKGGWILWHDYRGPKRNKDVFDALNHLSKTYPLQLIEKTSLAILNK